MKKVLVTGANGFIGSHCLPFVIERGFEVHAISSQDPCQSLNNTDWYAVDLFNPNKVRELVSSIKPNYLLHFAWDTTPGSYWHSEDNFRWVEASIGLLLAFAKAGGERAVMAGSCAEYDGRYGFCTEQLTPLKSTTPYGICKNSLRQLFESYCVQVGLGWAWGRIFFPYGPRENIARLVPSVIRALLQGEIANCSHGTQVRDYLYVKDVGNAFATLLDSEVQGPVNIASGQASSIKDIVNTIAENVGHHELIRLGGLKTTIDETPLLLADVSRLSNEVGWLPSYSLDDGILETITYWEQQLNN